MWSSHYLRLFTEKQIFKFRPKIRHIYFPRTVTLGTWTVCCTFFATCKLTSLFSELIIYSSVWLLTRFCRLFFPHDYRKRDELQSRALCSLWDVLKVRNDASLVFFFTSFRPCTRMTCDRCKIFNFNRDTTQIISKLAFPEQFEDLSSHNGENLLYFLC